MPVGVMTVFKMTAVKTSVGRMTLYEMFLTK
jgi:hypothetical protein